VLDNLDAWVVAAVLVAMVVLLARDRHAPAAVVVGAVVALMLTGAVAPERGLSGFASPATATIAGLLVVARAVEEHGGLHAVLSRLLGGDARPRAVLARLVFPVAAASAVVSNTAMVATLAPMVRRWARRNRHPASRYLMPLSFAAIVGGVVTLIGTSTTLLVSGIIAGQGLEPLGFLEITPVGLPAALLAGILLVVLAPKLLPDRTTAGESLAAREREYSFRMQVVPGGSLDGRTVREGQLRNLPDVFLARIERDGHVLAPVGPDQLLRGGDVLVFVGGVEDMRHARATDGLAHAEDTQHHLLDGDRHGLFEVVLGRSGRLLGRTLKEVSFRGHYGAAVLAVHRQGERVEGKLGTVTLQPGDSLVVQAADDFDERWGDRADFGVVVPLEDPVEPASRRRPLVLATFAGTILLAGSGLVPTLLAVLGACAVLIATRTVRFWQAKDALDVDVLLIVASAIGIGAAVQDSGLARSLAAGIVDVAGALGPLGALAAVVVGTIVLTELVTNVAAAALMVPIALDIATAFEADPRGFAIAVAVAASASFLTPIGYQTNTLVYGLGGYRFGDYWRLGLPLTLTVLATILVTVPLAFPPP
jgi:di/tricarboxylate transporter